MSDVVIFSVTEEEFYKIPSVEVLCGYTPWLASIMGVSLDEVSLEFAAMDDGVHGATDISCKLDSTPIYLNISLPLRGCDGGYLLFVFAHELQHYIQWKMGRLASCSDLATRTSQTVWEGSLFAYDPRDMSTPWEVEADLVAAKAMEELSWMIDSYEADDQAAASNS